MILFPSGELFENRTRFRILRRSRSFVVHVPSPTLVFNRLFHQLDHIQDRASISYSLATVSITIVASDKTSNDTESHKPRFFQRLMLQRLGQEMGPQGRRRREAANYGQPP